jgi:hypothetical protein
MRKSISMIALGLAVADFIALLLRCAGLLKSAPQTPNPGTGNVIEFPYRGTVLYITGYDRLSIFAMVGGFVLLILLWGMLARIPFRLRR